METKKPLREGVDTRAVFDAVATRYDLMNDLMSGGVHRLWKAALIDRLAPSKGRAMRLLDAAGGTGDVALRFLARAGAGSGALVADPNPKMIAEGQKRARGGHAGLSFVCAGSEALPFAEGAFDACTMAFGIRNVAPALRPQAFSETHRVLRPGGRFLCLEFSRLRIWALRPLYDAYTRHVLPALGRLVVGDGAPYAYLDETIRRFPSPETVCGMLEEAGFARVSHRPMSGGVVVLYSAWRI